MTSSAPPRRDSSAFSSLETVVSTGVRRRKHRIVGPARSSQADQCPWVKNLALRMTTRIRPSRPPPGFNTSLDYQYAVNPAYNRDRGLVNIYALRLHLELSKD